MSDLRVHRVGSVRCPQCASASRTLDSRPTVEGSTRRHRVCLNGHCGARFTTMEMAEVDGATNAIKAPGCPLLSEPFRAALKALLAEDVS